MANQVDLARYFDGDRNFKVARVFRDPAPQDSQSPDSKFEIWIAFQFSQNRLVGAQAFKTRGIGRLHDQLTVNSLDVKIARGVVLENDSHRTNDENVFRFIDHEREREFFVRGDELLTLLDEQLEKITPKTVRHQKTEAKPSRRSSQPNVPDPSKIARQNGDQLLADIDSLLEQSYGFIDKVRATTLDEPTRR